MTTILLMSRENAKSFQVSKNATMGIPYSKQINEAFDQVTPLVAEGFKVLETTKNISILLAVVQVLNTFLLFLILGTLIALLITTSPDLEQERRILITPVLRWFTTWLTDDSSRQYLGFAIFVVIIGVIIGTVGGLYSLRRSEMEAIAARQSREGSNGDTTPANEEEGS
jgi:hypothetical protein